MSDTVSPGAGTPAGRPCWYELGTTDLDAASAFYPRVLGWSVGPGMMPEMDYRLARVAGQPVAGMMATAGQAGAPPPNWLCYVEVADVDATAARVLAAGGRIVLPPDDVPGAGRFAVLCDPQQAHFGVLASSSPDEGRQPFDPAASGHVHWHELMTPDPEAAMAFYGELFGWTPGETYDMGEQGVYRLFEHRGQPIGGMMKQGQSPMPAWLPYFGVDDVAAAVASLESAGGRLTFGPMTVPGPSQVAGGIDPQGAAFAIIGPQP